MQEIVTLRTRHAKHYDLGNGQRQAVIQRGQHYQDKATGKFEDTDCTWQLDTGTDPQGNAFGWKVKKTDANLRIFDQNPNKKRLRVGFDTGVFVDYELPNVASVHAGNKATFADAWLSTDLEYVATPEGVKGDIVLKETGHPASFSFPLTATNCTPQKEGNGLAFYRNAQLIGGIPAPYAEDANGGIGDVALDYDGTSVRFVPDPIWLASAAYPVTVDPTTVIQPDGTAGIDAYIYNWNASTNYGTANAVQIGRAVGYTTRLLQTFTELSSIPPTAVVISAVHSVYNYGGIDNNPLDFGLYPIDTAWTEMGVTWNTQPTYGARTHIITISAVGSWASVEMTSLVSEWVNGSRANNGFMMRVEDESVTAAYKRLYTSDYTTDVTLRPKLTVTYTEAAPANQASIFGTINALGRRLIG